MKHYYQYMYMLMVGRDFFLFNTSIAIETFAHAHTHCYASSSFLLYSSFIVTVAHARGIPSTIYFPFRPNAPTTFALCENLANKNRFFFSIFFPSLETNACVRSADISYMRMYTYVSVSLNVRAHGTSIIFYIVIDLIPFHFDLIQRLIAPHTIWRCVASEMVFTIDVGFVAIFWYRLKTLRY